MGLNFCLCRATNRRTTASELNVVSATVAPRTAAGVEFGIISAYALG